MRVWLKLALALLLAGLAPLVIAATLIVEGDVERLTESARAYHLATAEVALGEARSLVARALAETRALGSALARSDAPASDREAAARALLVGAELVDSAAVYTPEGTRLFEMRAGDHAASAAPPALRASELRDAEARGHVLLEVTRRPDGAVTLPLLVPATRPAATPGAPPEVYAYLVAEVSLAPLSELTSELGLRHFGRPERVRLLDGNLRVLAGAAPDELLRSLAQSPAVDGISRARGAFGRDVAYTIDYVDPSGTALIGAIVPLPELGWAALVEQEQDEAYAPVAATWRTALWIGVAVAALAVLLALLVGRRLARPVEAIAEASARVATGDFAARVPVTRRDEIGRTAEAFNRMATDLGAYRERLVDETRARDRLARFLSPEVVERIVSGKEALALGGERREVTVMFADVVAFTTLADEHEPEATVAILNELFTIITEIVFQHGGIIDKFIGDCAMAIWGAPESHADDARRAVRAAEAILRWLEVANAKWRKQLGRDLELAIGIHTGSAVVGNIGSEKRMEYTAIGDAVNIAARLERLARPNQILMTRETMQRVADEFPSHSLGTYNIVGRSRPSEIFVLSG